MIIMSILLILLTLSVNLSRDSSMGFNRVTEITLTYSFLMGLNILYFISLDGGVGLYGGLFHTTTITQVFHIFVYFVCIVIIQLTSFYPMKVWLKKYLKNNIIYKFISHKTEILDKISEHLKITEYPLIIIFIVTGAVFLISTSDLISIFLSIELQSYGLYLLSTLYKNSELATSGGLTYFLLGSLSSCFILLGSGILYANSGTTNLDGVFIITSINDIINNGMDKIVNWFGSYYISYSLLILSIGFLFKISAAPFHFWSPYVYDAIPTIVTTFVAIIAKISILIFLLELVYYTSNFLSNFSWISALLISSLISLIIGTVVGLSQFRVKRLYAYSTISHLGFLLLALSINSIESIQAFFFYLTQYTISNLNAFVLLISIGFSLYNYSNPDKDYKELSDKNNSPVQLIKQLKGYFYINPYISLSLAITIFSFVGIPPTIGFFAKQMVLSAALDNGYIFLALVGILTSVIGAVYYLNVIKQIFFDKHEYIINSEKVSIDVHKNTLKKNIIEVSSIKLYNVMFTSSLTIVISIITLIILLFILIPIEWLSIANILAMIIFKT